MARVAPAVLTCLVAVGSALASAPALAHDPRTKAKKLSQALDVEGVGRLTAAGAGEEAAVIAAVQRFFETMAACDVAGMRAVVEPEGRIVRLRAGPGAESVTSTSTFGEFLARLRAPRRALAACRRDPRTWSPPSAVTPRGRP
jgi:hypothetical protein